MSSIELIEKIKNNQGVRKGAILRDNLRLKTLPPATVSESSAKIRGVVSDFFPPAFFGDSVDLHFSYKKVDEPIEDAQTVFVDTFSEDLSRTVVSKDIEGLERNTAYEFFLFGEIDDTRVASEPPRVFETGVFSIKTVEATNIQQEQATLNGELAQFEGLVFEKSGPFEIESSTNSGATTFANTQDSESPLFVLNDFSNQNLQTTVNSKDGKLSMEIESPTVNFSVSDEVDIEVLNDPETFNLTPEVFSFQSEITRDVNAGFEYRKVGDQTFKDAFTVSPPDEAGDTFSATVSLDPNSDYEFRAFGTIGSFERTKGDLKTFSTEEKEIVELETADSSFVKVTEATVGGSVTNIEPSGTEINVGTNYGESVQNNQTPLQSTLSLTSFTRNLSGLEAATTYEYQTVAEGISSGETYFGPIKTFTTEAIIVETLPQSTSTDPSKEPTEGTSFLFGEIQDLNPDSSGANVEFVYGKQEPLGSIESAGTKSPSDGQFSTSVQGLDAGSEYKYRISATDPTTGETKTGQIETFTTVDLGVETIESSSIGKTSATLTGNVTDLNTSGTYTVYFEYREKGNTAFNSTSDQTFTSKTSYSETISSLTEGTVYEYRAVIEKNTATVKGEIKDFQTKSVEITTNSASNVKTGSADFAGELTFISSGVSEVEVYFDFREQGISNETRVFADNTPLSSTGTFSASVTGLNANTTYEYRALADPDGAREQSASFQTFTTNNLDVSTANIPSSRTRTSVTIGGEILAYGGDFATEDITVGHQYIRRGSGSIEISGTEKVSFLSPVSSLTTYATTITGLQNGTKYDVRAFARVGGTTVFGKLQRVSTNLNSNNTSPSFDNKANLKSNNTSPSFDNKANLKHEV